MSGTKTGGKNAALTNKLKYGQDFYARIGQIGGRKGTTGGFASPNPCNCDDLTYRHRKAECAGMKGGKTSRKPRKVVYER